MMGDNKKIKLTQSNIDNDTTWPRYSEVVIGSKLNNLERVFTLY